MNNMISIVIPFYNPGVRILDAIRSVFVQTHSNWELILLDDGSNDGSTIFLKKITDPRVRVVSDGIRKGLAFRLNQMCNLCKGDYIARMDADDLMFPIRLQKQYEFFRANKVDVLSSSAIIINDNLEAISIRSAVEVKASFLNFSKSCPIIHPTVFAKKTWFCSHKYDENLLRAQDRDLWLRTADLFRFYNMIEPMLFYRETLDSNLHNISKGYFFERKILRKNFTREVNFFVFLHLYLLTYLKQFTRIGVYMKNKFLPFLKNNAHSSDLVNKYKKEISIIVDYKIPGYDKF
jgi:glycosyltransferase involved in cell wall biosynthesis